MAEKALGPIVRRTVRADVVDAVREAIQQQRLAPNTRLSDSELGGQLGVTHSTVREALHHLTHERLVVRPPHRGFFVAGFSLGDMIDLLEMRGMLEGRIAEVVAPQLDDRALDEIERAASAINYDPDGPNHPFWEADLAFHQLIVGRCPKPILTELWSTLSSRLTLLELLFHDSFETSLIDSRAHHLAYYAGLRSSDPAQARHAAEEHYRNPVARLRQGAGGREGG